MREELKIILTPFYREKSVRIGDNRLTSMTLPVSGDASVTDMIPFLSIFFFSFPVFLSLFHRFLFLCWTPID